MISMLHKTQLSCQIAVFILSTATVTSHADQASLLNEVIEAHKLRSKTYDNGHYLWILSETIDNASHERHYEYWARNGNYLRFDEELRVNGKLSSPAKSIIIRPEGFVILLKHDDQGRDVAIDFGPAIDGLPKIRQQFILERENKIAEGTVESWLQKSKEPGEILTDLNLVEMPNDRLKIIFSRDAPQGTRRYEGILSAEDFRVLSWRYIFNGAKGSEFENRFGDQETQNQYDEPAKLVPIKLLESFRTHDGDTTSQWDLVEYDFTPAAIDVFSIPGDAITGSSPASPTWIRRLIILAIGVTLIASYLWLRKKSRIQQNGSNK